VEIFKILSQFVVGSSSVCHRAQKKFDDEMLKGKIGNFQRRPECDDDGFFKPTICIDGQTYIW
jgi:hypothetical protein